jgi:hypothetical protein
MQYGKREDRKEIRAMFRYYWFKFFVGLLPASNFKNTAGLGVNPNLKLILIRQMHSAGTLSLQYLSGEQLTASILSVVERSTMLVGSDYLQNIIRGFSTF